MATVGVRGVVDLAQETADGAGGDLLVLVRHEALADPHGLLEEGLLAIRLGGGDDAVEVHVELGVGRVDPGVAELFGEAEGDLVHLVGGELGVAAQIGRVALRGLGAADGRLDGDLGGPEAR